MTAAGTLRGISDITDRFLGECLDPRSWPSSSGSGPELPLVVLLGPRGSGKSTLLRRIEERCRREEIVPVARLDLKEREQESPGQIAAALAFMLAHRLEGVPSPSFPRLLLGQVVLDAELGGDDPAEAHRRIDQLLRRGTDEGNARERMGLVGDLLETTGFLPPGGRLALELAVAGTSLPLLARRPAHRRALEWYGRDTADARDALATLNRYWRSPDENERHSVHEAQCGAFLADLRGYRAKRTSRVCVALLDNVDSPAGTRFLDTLIRVREAWDVTDPSDRDSLLVIATSSRRPGTWSAVAPSEDLMPPRPPEQARYADWAQAKHDVGGDAAWWYPILLRGLGLGDLDAVASLETRRVRAAHPERAATLSDLTAAIHRMTGGHSWAVRALIGATLHRSPDTSRADALRRALDTPVRQPLGPIPEPDPLRLTEGASETTQVTVGALALERMVREDFDSSEIASLTALAAAWNPGDSTELDHRVPVPAAGFPQLYQKLKDHLWLVENASTDPRLRPSKGKVPFVPQPRERCDIHPWLRTLLLHRLARMAAPPAGSGVPDDAWWLVHDGLRTDFRREAVASDEPGLTARLTVRALHHSMAVSDLAEVVDYLRDRWYDQETGSAVWLDDFNMITLAPNRLPKDEDPLALLERLAGPALATSEIERMLWRLIGARWILADPLADPAGGLRRIVGDLLRTLGARAGNGFQLFYDEADRYR